MTKVLKKTFLIFVSLFAFLFAGFFFVGCGVDTSKISLTSETKFVSIGVDEEVDIYFNLTNYQKGFSNKISVSERSTTGASVGDQGAIFSASDVSYVSASRMKVTIKGLHGGDGTIYARTLQEGKECLIDIHVSQYSTTFEEGTNTLYVTNNAEFTPSANLFTFDPNTTEKDLSYYYFTPRTDFNLNTYYLSSINTTTQSVSFSDGVGGTAEGSIVKFDKAWLSDDNKIELSYLGEVVEKPFVDDFYMLSVYDYSVNNEKYEKILYAISTVHVLPSLDVSVSGGYLVGEDVVFSPLEKDATIKIVPNNSKMRMYIIKLEIENSISSSAIEMEKITDGTNYLDIDVATDFHEAGASEDKQVYYWKISQNSQAQIETKFGFRVFYNIAQDVSVDSVNYEVSFVGDLEIAPIAITVNGTTEPEKLMLYNHYGSSSSGWKELSIGVISGYNISPSYDGVYFEFDNSLFDITYEGTTVLNGDSRLYSDLNKPFYIKGKNVDQTTANIKIHLKSDILQDAEELTQEIECEIVSGARVIEKEMEYRAQDIFYLDVNGGEQPFSKIAYADEKFQSMTYSSIGISDIVKIEFDNTNPYIEENGVYYLNMKVTPLAVGDSSYRIYLDNGVYKDFAFKTIKTLQPETSAIKLADTGNANVTNMSYSRYDDQSVFDDVLDIEILNASDANKVTYGSVANVVISANVTGIDYTIGNTDNIIIVSQTSSIGNSSNVNYRITTAKNGNADVTFNLRGTNVENFATVDVSEAVYLNVNSYSLITEFNVKNGDGFANENIVYYGSNASDENKSVTFTINANNQDAFNFYRYGLKENIIADIYETEIPVGSAFEIDTDDIDEPVLVNERFARKFVYYYVQRQNGRSVKTYTNVTVVKNDDESTAKTVLLEIANGLMFVGTDLTYTVKDEYGAEGDKYRISFSNTYSIGDGLGTFDLESLTYTVGDSSEESSILVISANLRQRSSTKKYNMTIRPTEFVAVEAISLASSLTKLNFSNSNLTYTFGVYTYPTYSTNKNIQVEFVRTRVNPEATDKYLDLLTYTIDKSNSANGVYTVTLSCESFYQKHALDIEKIEDALTGIVYIYPSEWGSSYTTISDKEPIVLEMQYRNGSKANPYLIESADDILEMNSNAVMLKSSYEISSVVDVSVLRGATPIGILNGEIVGFSGTIIGSTSQAQVKNILLSESNFSAIVGSTRYAGLFARINSGAVIENLSVSGSMNFGNVTTNIEIGLLAAENYGQVINVGATVGKSKISVTGKDAKIGGLVGIDSGEIYQDFKRYNAEYTTDVSGESDYVPGYHYNQIGTTDHSDSEGFEIDELGRRIVYEYVIEDGEIQYNPETGEPLLKALPASWDYSGQNTKILAYFNDVMEITTANATIYAGGVVGLEKGRLARYLSEDVNFKMYGYSAYTAYTLLNVSGSVRNGILIKAGGIAGEINTTGTTSSAMITNVLVGGEVDTSAVEGLGTEYDNVGGIAGRADGPNIAIQNNTSRVFLRANVNVGGIVGAEIQSSESPVTWGTKNTIENVDDGRSAFYAAMIIKYNAEEERAEAQQETLHHAIGATTRSYDTHTSFAAYTYLQRTQLSSAIDKNNTATNAYYGDYLAVDKNDLSQCEKYLFTYRAVEVEFSGNNELSGGKEGVHVYFMYYFSVDGTISDSGASSQANAQEAIAKINYIGPSSNDYPFEIVSQDVSVVSANQNILAIDVNGFMTIKGTGLCTVTLSSILNVNIAQKNYIYIVNYFNKDVATSIYYSSPSSNGRKMSSGSTLNIYGNQSSNLYIVPDYESAEKKTVDNESYSVTPGGILSYQNVLFVLSKNAYITSTYVKAIDNDITRIQVNKQTIIFHKTDNANTEYSDVYLLTPTLSLAVLIDGQTYQYTYKLDGAQMELHTSYREAATAINVHYRDNAIRTNNPFKDYVTVISTNEDEKLFYQIFKKEDDGNMYLVQNKMPDNIADVDSYEIEITNNDLFNLQFTKRAGQNIFDYACYVNTYSKAFINRFSEPIYGDYVVYLYASELEDGVSSSFNIRLDEASVNYIVATNYSNINDVSVADEVVVPAQSGLIEVSVDPIEAIFDKFTISNNVMNYKTGAGQARFTFVYEKDNSGEISYEYGYSFVTSETGTLSFTYQQMLKFLEQVGAVNYKGKVYVGYFVASNNVEDAMPIAFDINVTYGEEESVSTTIEMVTKLSSYAKLVFNNREAVDGDYYVARGLSYNLTLQYYGFSESQITINSTDVSVATISGGDGRYTLAITSDPINYNADDPGYKVIITTSASKTVDGVTISTSTTMTLYVMEYVLNYIYEEGVNRDIVSGVRGGIIDDAIGNPYTLSMDLTSFVEYDKTNASVVEELGVFLKNLTTNTKFTVYYDGTEETLEANKTFRTDYYIIKSFTVTPIKLYNAASEIYYFSVDAQYSRKQGVYTSALDSVYKIYSEFSFEVHNQSTENSPIPVETYTELMSMSDGEWYILTKDIVIPDDTMVEIGLANKFEPITANIKGLDGNGHSIIFGGTYTIEGANFGLFARVNDGTVLKNIAISIASDVNFSLSSSDFNVGLLTPENEGIITNCSIKAIANAPISVLSTKEASASYVAGIAASNSGFITNSQVSVNIKTNANLAGLVGQNSGLIASSYYKGASLENTTGTINEYVAGIAVVNSGRIYTSYVSGDTSGCTEKMYYNLTANALTSSNNLAGFVYSNSGEILDCYSNIKINSGAYAAGFVFENSGTVSRCFSTSVLASEQTSNYGFVYRNSINSSEGLIEDAYYLSDVGVNQSIGEITPSETVELEKLTCTGFADMSKFEHYVYENRRSANAVWFYSNTNDAGSFNGTLFNTGRLELVAPNIVATSMRELDHIENVVDPDTGAVYANYVYVYKDGYPTLGSVYNPIVIYDYETMEDYIVSGNNNASFNYNHYRLVSDIDYTDSTENNKTYKTRFMGYLEGNFMTINGISMMSDESLVNVGLFAEIGSATNTDAIGTVMNFTIKPKTVSYVAANCVGTIAGRVNAGSLININVEIENEQVVVNGNNVVGGVVGCATGNYKMINVYSQLGAKARRQNIVDASGEETNVYDESSENYNEYSFAGSIAGVATGNGTIKNLQIRDGDIISSLADKAGLMFGLIDKNVSVEKLEIYMNASMIVNAYRYGGLVAGEIKGTLSNVSVYGFGGGVGFKNFKKSPFMPIAIGGIAGMINGATLSNVSMGQSIEIASESDTEGVENLGGIAGIIRGDTNLSDVTINASLVGFSSVGGIAGTIESNEGERNFVRLLGANIVLNKAQASGRELTQICVGGVAGKVTSGVSLQVAGTTNRATIRVLNLSVKTYVYNEQVSVYVGAVVGQKASNETFYISSVDSQISGEVRVNEMTKPNEQKTATYNNGTVDVGSDIISPTTITSEDCKTQCSITYAYPHITVAGSTQLYTLYIQNYGEWETSLFSN